MMVRYECFRIILGNFQLVTALVSATFSTAFGMHVETEALESRSSNLCKLRDHFLQQKQHDIKWLHVPLNTYVAEKQRHTLVYL